MNNRFLIFGTSIILFTLLFTCCNKPVKSSENKTSEVINETGLTNYLSGFKINKIQDNSEYIILHYEYVPDSDAVGYSEYGIYEGELYIKRKNDVYVPILNVVINKEKAFGEKLHLDKIVKKDNIVELLYYIEPYGKLAYGAGQIKIVFKYDNGVFSVINYDCDIISRFSLDEETNDEYPDPNGKIIYKVELSKEDFIKILEDKKLGY